MVSPRIDCHDLAQHVGSWMTTRGKESDVVISCRIRLARNVEGRPFVSRLAPEAASELCEELHMHLLDEALDGETYWVVMNEAEPLLRLMLRERHLISRDLAPSERPSPVLRGRAVAFGDSETVSAMINEEDHLRIQGLAAGYDLDLAWKRACDLDRRLEQRIPFAYTRDLGYLTGCPTNVGTGLRASVMLHLPALGLVQSELEKVFTAAQRTGLAVRGLYGEGTRAAGDFYQISNQVTLGRTEANLIDDLRELVPVIANFERKVREALVDDQPEALKDRVSRSYGELRGAKAMPTETALAHLSNVRMGFHMGIFKGAPIDDLNQLGVQIQRGHIQALHQEKPTQELLDVSERDKLRASFLRRRLAER